MKQDDRVVFVDGKVQTCAKFSVGVQHAEIVESREFKALRADVFVLCSGQFLLQQLGEVGYFPPLMRVPTSLLLARTSHRLQTSMFFNGAHSVLTPDELPFVG